MSHEQGKAAVVVNSGRGHSGFNLKFLLKGKVLAGARGSCAAGNHVWAGSAVPSAGVNMCCKLLVTAL